MAKLVRFIVLKPALGPKEGEEEKRIVFYHPVDDDVRTKCKHAGFAEAAQTFAGVFFDSASKPLRCVQTRQTKTAFLKPEDGTDFAMCMTVALPSVKKSEDQIEFNPDAVHDEGKCDFKLCSYLVNEFFFQCSSPF